MKLIISALSLLNGGYMLLDGIYVMLSGKYIGPEKPGPWAFLFEKLSVNVFKLGPLFIAVGIGWLVFLVGVWTNQAWSFSVGVCVSILTLWYFPIGTLFSVIILITLLTARRKLGL